MREDKTCLAKQSFLYPNRINAKCSDYRTYANCNRRAG